MSLKIIFFHFLIIFSTNSFADPLYMQNEFDPDLCVNGISKPWVAACVCTDPLKYYGKYCSDEAFNNCYSNADCEKGQYCFVYKDIGRCMNTYVRGPIKFKQKEMVLSDNVLNYTNAIHFCKALGIDWRIVKREDFLCHDMGPSCLNKNMLIELQAKVGKIGFFWLEEKIPEKESYYADLNDGTIYQTSQTTDSIVQSLCVKEK